MSRFLNFALLGCVMMTQIGTARAGLYQEDVIAEFDIDADGYAVPLGFQSFRAKLGKVVATDRPDSERSKEIQQAIEKRRKKGTKQLTPQELVAQSADLLRLRRDENCRNEVIDLLRPLIARPPAGVEFLILAHLAQAHQIRKEYQEAFTSEYSAVKDYDFPKSILGMSEKQLTWYRRLEKEYYLPFLEHRRNEGAGRKASVRDGLDPIFPYSAKSKAAAVLFVGESGKYEAGTIAAAEKAKLPRDAIAIVQQLFLWDPDDNRLLWQLAELYNASGDVGSAATLMDFCVDAPRQYSNPELLEHRRIIQKALPAWLEAESKKREEAERQMQAEEAKTREEFTRKRDEQQRQIQFEKAAEEQSQRDRAEREVWVKIGIATVLVFVIYWQAREFWRRWRTRRAKGTRG